MTRAHAEPPPQWPEAVTCLHALTEALDMTALAFDPSGRCLAGWGRPLPGDAGSVAAAAGRTCAALLGVAAERAFGEALSGGSGEYEWRLDCADGARLYQVRLDTVRGSDASACGVLASIREVSEERRAQAWQVLAGRVAAVGKFVGGVAHAVNSPLAAVVANLEFTQRELRDLREHAVGDRAPSNRAALADLDEAIADARSAADRIRGIVRDLQRFSSPDHGRREDVDVNRAVDAALALTWPEMRYRARLVKELGRVSPVSVNEAVLRQVLLNLFLNAAQAIAEGDVEHNEIRVLTRQDPDGHVVIQVRDTGAGIPVEAQAHIFDPLYTTKRTDAGMGVGLAACYQFVASAGGRIDVEAEPGRGALFRISLPPAPAAPSPAEALVPATTARMHGRVLVIDDDAAVCAAIRRALARDHEVLVATSATAALAQVAAGAQVDVIVCDLLMPELSGMDVYERVEQIDPALARKMLFLTGGAFTPRSREFLARVPNPRLDKPFDIKNLAALIDRMLR